jgi:hypothetical protein
VLDTSSSVQLQRRAAGARSKARVCARSGDAAQWRHRFRCTSAELAQAVRAVGNDPLDVAVYLERLCLDAR